jgi:phage-related protein
MDPAITIVYEIGSSSITISKTSIYRLLAIDGLEAADIEMNMADSATADGGYVMSERVISRTIVMSFVIFDQLQTETYRSALINFLKPKVEGTLTITRNGVTRKIKCRMAIRPEFKQANIINDQLVVTVTLLCPDPYFYATTATTSNETSANVITVTNPGDAECGCTISITATGGAVINPYFTLVGTGEFVYIIQSMVATKVLQVSTVPGSCFAKYDGTEIYTYTLDSNFFKLEVGSNTITLDSDTGEAYIVGSISFTPRYLGV